MYEKNEALEQCRAQLKEIEHMKSFSSSELKKYKEEQAALRKTVEELKAKLKLSEVL